MAQHSNYAKDRDLMMEAYSSVSGYVPRTSTTALPRGYVLTESNCSDEEDTIDSIKLGGKLYEVGNDDPNDDGLIIDIEKRANGYFITGGVYSEPEDFVNDPGKPKEGYGYALDLDGNPMEADDLEGGNPTAPKEDSEGHHPSGSDDGECDECGGLGCDVCNGTGEQDEEHSEDGEEQPSDEFFDMLDDVLMIIGSGDYDAVITGMKVKLGKKELSPLETEHVHNVIQDDELPDDDPYKGEGDAEGYQGYR